MDQNALVGLGSVLREKIIQCDAVPSVNVGKLDLDACWFLKPNLETRRCLFFHFLLSLLSRLLRAKSGFLEAHKCE